MLVVLLATAALRAQTGIHASEVCFQGDHLAQIAPLLKRLKYKLVAPETTVDANAAQQFICATPWSARTRPRFPFREPASATPSAPTKRREPFRPPLPRSTVAGAHLESADPAALSLPRASERDPSSGARN
jgi:hypothetical protein